MPREKKTSKSIQVPPYPSPDLVPFTPGKGHVALMFQPTHYKVVSTPEELQQWEQLMIKDVGFDPRSSIFNRDAQGNLIPSGSLSFSYCCWQDRCDLDDCDEM